MPSDNSAKIVAPSLPKGGGAVQGIGEKFQPSVFDGTGSFSIPIPLTGGRDGFGPKLALQYSTGHGSDLFGLGWSLGLPGVSRKTDKGLPTYTEADVFVLSGAEDLVPMEAGSPLSTRLASPAGFTVRAYRPRTEGLFACIERWTHDGSQEEHWRVTTKENVTSLYGRASNARVADPDDPAKVSEWLIEETFDSRGNHMLYRYASDVAPPAVLDPRMVEESNAFTMRPRPSARRYLRRILYGNLPSESSEGADGEGSAPVHAAGRVTRRYAFEVVFDYGDWPLSRALEQPTIPKASYIPPLEEEVIPGPSRPDASSSFRSGFEVRTRLRCERVLMYHHIGVDAGLPVKATCFRYDRATHSGQSLLADARVAGYREQGEALVVRALPAVSFEYTPFKPGEQRFVTMRAREDQMPPFSLEHPEYELVDLFGDAMPDVVHSSERAFMYWRNLGSGNFDMPRVLPTTPAGLSLAAPGVQFADSDGDALIEMVVQTDAVRASFELASDLSWETSRYLDNIPVSDGRDPNARRIDLTGDGLPDLLITRDHHWLWYENLGADGFVPRDPIELADPDFDPDLRDVFLNDPSGRIRLADMTGDGLTDIVRIHWGTVEYWPNKGRGKFGQRVVMGTLPDSPALDTDFDPARLFLVDLDGSGCSDLVYVRNDRVDLWFNQSGNGWIKSESICGTPAAPGGTGLAFADIFGTGTATLVWSRNLGEIPGGNYFALDFCGGVKPHLLTGMDNGLGAQTRVTYAPSTEFLHLDRAEGIEWHTSLPFPVHVVKNVEVIDKVSLCRHTTSYRYRHGFYDGREREFRGFAYVEQTDTEVFDLFKNGTVEGDPAANIDEALHLPPVVTKSWFHTGAWLEAATLADKLRTEFWQGDPAAFTLDDHEVADDPEACRALRGAVLRSEVYSLDSDPLNAAGSKAGLPYSVTESRYRVRSLQARGTNLHGVFHTSTAESITHHYERNAADPRVTHEISGEPDDFGNITDKVSIAYPRRATPARIAGQVETKIVFSHSDVINHAVPDEAWLIGVPYQSRSFEFTGVSATGPGGRYLATDFASLILSNAIVPYHEAPPARSAKRLIDWSRIYFRRDSDADDLNAPSLALGEIEPLAIPHETLKAAFPDALGTRVYGGQVNDTALTQAGYVREADVADHWWIASGRMAFDAESFYLPMVSVDPFGNASSYTYDEYALLPESFVDALQNVVIVINDYRVMQPSGIISPNGHMAEAAFDALGRVVGTAVRSSGGEGDTLNQFDPDPTSAAVRVFVDDPRGVALELLQGASTRLVYDLYTAPVFHATIARTEHQTDNATPEVLLTFAYSDGFGREAQTKVQAEPDEDGNPQWAATGWKIYNNKGKPVRQFEPFFSSSHEFQPEEKHGVSPYLFYDPLGRVIATLKPDHTWEKVVFDPWKQTTFDAQDNVLVADPQLDPDVGLFFNKLPQTEWSPTWYDRMKAAGAGSDQSDAADKAAAHANTPSVVHLDVLARPVLAVGDLGGGKTLTTKTSYDILGNVLTITDPRGIVAFTHEFDMLKRQLSVNSADAGASQLLPDVLNAPMLSWDANGNHVRALYDELHRPTERWLLKPGENVYRLTQKMIYGESANDPAANLRGQTWKVFDGAGLAQNLRFDFKANLREAQRILWSDPLTQPEWGSDADPRAHVFDEAAAMALLDAAHTYTASSDYDALNRLVRTTTPDGSVQTFVFNEASLLNEVRLQHRGESAVQVMVKNIDYNAKGQRERIRYGNDVVTLYEYDDNTFRLIHLTSQRRASAGSDPGLQDLSYTYDAVGNITCIRDEAHDRVFFGSGGVQHIVDPEMRYDYDALYRLTRATGREHAAMGACHYSQSDQQQTEFYGIPQPQPMSNGKALVNYTQLYSYDDGGNITEIKHMRGPDTPWTRAQTYAATSNRILTSGADCDRAKAVLAHDANGNLTHLQHLPSMEWNDRNQLTGAQLNVAANNPDRAFYQYDAGGQRVRKTIVRAGSTKERIYLGGFEIFVVRNAQRATERWETLHVSDGDKRIALIETETDPHDPTRVLDSLTRFQLGNHLGSAVLELDGSASARIISYEEFTPYGETAYIAGANESEVRRKRYRYSGKERDNESGLSYHCARYLAPWMGRWVSCDPIGIKGGMNLFLFASASPVTRNDPNGCSDRLPDESQLPAPDLLDAEGRYRYTNNNPGLEDHLKKCGYVPHPQGPPYDSGETGRTFEVNSSAQGSAGRYAIRVMDGQPDGSGGYVVNRGPRVIFTEKRVPKVTKDEPTVYVNPDGSSISQKRNYYGQTGGRGMGSADDDYQKSVGHIHYTKTSKKPGEFTTPRLRQYTGYASPAPLIGAAAVSGAIGIYQVATINEKIDDALAAIEPDVIGMAMNNLQSQNLMRRLKGQSTLDLQVVHAGQLGDELVNRLIDPRTGNLYAVITEITNDHSVGDLVLVGSARAIIPGKVFKDDATKDTYANINGWQIIGPYTGFQELFPGQ